VIANSTSVDQVWPVVEGSVPVGSDGSVLNVWAFGGEYLRGSQASLYRQRPLNGRIPFYAQYYRIELDRFSQPIFINFTSL
jgi:hypothetical protein